MKLRMHIADLLCYISLKDLDDLEESRGWKIRLAAADSSYSRSASRSALFKF